MVIPFPEKNPLFHGGIEIDPYAYGAIPTSSNVSNTGGGGSIFDEIGSLISGGLGIVEQAFGAATKYNQLEDQYLYGDRRAAQAQAATSQNQKLLIYGAIVLAAIVLLK